jgi:hypothetical protein
LENLLALARDVVGVTLGMSCMAAIVLHVPGEDGGVMPPVFQVWLPLGFRPGFQASQLCLYCARRRCWRNMNRISVATVVELLSRPVGVFIEKWQLLQGERTQQTS